VEGVGEKTKQKATSFPIVFLFICWLIKCKKREPHAGWWVGLDELIQFKQKKR
jgi:hypothetical protein